MRDIDQSDIESVCREFLSDSQGILSWIWDSRFDTVLAQFSIDNKDQVSAILKRHFGNTWNSSNINKASNAVQKVNKRLGGLKPEQRLFTSDLTSDVFIFCAWWPWNDGKTISVRIAPFYKKLSLLATASRIESFRGLFGI
jgi:hypothetical protein